MRTAVLSSCTSGSVIFCIRWRKRHISIAIISRSSTSCNVNQPSSAISMLLWVIIIISLMNMSAGILHSEAQSAYMS